MVHAGALALPTVFLSLLRQHSPCSTCLTICPQNASAQVVNFSLRVLILATGLMCSGCEFFLQRCNDQAQSTELVCSSCDPFCSRSDHRLQGSSAQVVSFSCTVQGSHSLEWCNAALSQQRALDTVSRAHTPGVVQRSPLSAKSPGHCVQGS